MGAYFRNLVRSLMGQLHITIEDLRSPDDLDDSGAQYLYLRRSEEIKHSLRCMRPGTLGRIAVHGKPFEVGVQGTAMYQVHCASWLGKYEDGKSLLIEIACTAIVAEMTDILMGQTQRDLIISSLKAP